MSGHPPIPVVERNIAALLQRQRNERLQRGVPERLADIITTFAGSLSFVLSHLLLVIAWVVVNLGWTALAPFDPTFVILATIASVEAIFLTSFVLITQNRLQRDSDRRSDLDLQISLLSEHEITRLIGLVRSVAERLDVAPEDDRELDELEQDVQPEHVLETLDRKQQHR
jgi:uncharacterized membrane protein